MYESDYFELCDRYAKQEDRVQNLEEKTLRNEDLIERLVELIQNDTNIDLPQTLEKIIKKKDIKLKNLPENNSLLVNKDERNIDKKINCKKLRRRRKLELAWRKLTSNASIHGLPRIMKTDKLIIKFVWLLMILGSATCGVYTIVNTSREYTKYDVITQTKKIEEAALIFPAITFCQLQNNSKNIKDAMTSCKYDYAECNVSRDFEYFSLREGKYLLNCLRFNGYMNHFNNSQGYNGLKMTRGTDHTNGLLIDFEMDLVEDYLLAYITDNYLNSYERITSLLFSTQVLYNIYITKSVEKKLELPYNPCLIIDNETYRQQNCISLCIHRNVANKYNCSFPGFYSRNISNYELFQIDCNDIDSKKKEFRYKCHNQCPKECDSMSFGLTVTSNAIKNQTTQRLINFSAFFSDFSYLEITQIPKMTAFSLIASIGGSLALFIGIRFLSLVEILEFFIDVFYALVIDR